MAPIGRGTRAAGSTTHSSSAFLALGFMQNNPQAVEQFTPGFRTGIIATFAG
jgi:hypothetical protein